MSATPTPKQALILWCLLGRYGSALQSAIAPRIDKADREALIAGHDAHWSQPPRGTRRDLDGIDERRVRGCLKFQMQFAVSRGSYVLEGADIRGSRADFGDDVEVIEHASPVDGNAKQAAGFAPSRRIIFAV